MVKVRNEVTPESVSGLVNEVIEQGQTVMNKQTKPWSRLALFCIIGVAVFEYMAPGHGIVELVKQNRTLTEYQKTAREAAEQKAVDGTFRESRTPEEPAKETAAGTVTVTAASLNIRNAPDGDVIGTAQKGQSFEYYDITDNNWYRILYEGEDAYLFGKYLSK